jgi:hypothetical protein
MSKLYVTDTNQLRKLKDKIVQIIWDLCSKKEPPVMTEVSDRIQDVKQIIAESFLGVV